MSQSLSRSQKFGASASYVTGFNSSKKSHLSTRIDSSKSRTSNEEEVLLEQYQMKASKVRANYFVGVAIQGMEKEVAMLAKVMGSDWLTDERLGLIHQAYLAKADALELLHSQPGHMPYSRIEIMIAKGIIKGMSLDNKTIEALKREKCHVCMRSKNTDAAHNRHIPVGSNAWVNFETDITAMFDQASLYGNK